MDNVMTVGELLEEMRSRLERAKRIQKRPAALAILDIHELLSTDIQTMIGLLDEIEYDLKDVVQTRFTQERKLEEALR